MDLELYDDPRSTSIEEYDDVISIPYSSSMLENYLIGAFAIIHHLSPIIITIIITRIFHLITDIIHLKSRYNWWVKYSISIASTYFLLRFFLDNNFHGLSLITINNLIMAHFDGDRFDYFYRSIIVRYLSILIPYELITFCTDFNGKMRGIFMILIMKATTVNDHYHDVLLYLFHPASFLFGPWHRKSFGEIQTEPQSATSSEIWRIFLSQIVKSSKIFSKAILILMISTNIGDILAYLLESYLDIPLISTIFTVYLTALEFRLSHYFILYLSHSFISLWVEYEKDDKFQMCDIFKIEWPRSLVEVVIYWDTNMHFWIKNYVFKPMKAKNYNSFITILCTYLTSCLLHGCKFHIWAVLLSLGVFTWIEYNIRLKLSKKLNACVMSKECIYDSDQICKLRHINTHHNSLKVSLINFFFRILAIIQLAYLGCIFVGDTDTASFREPLKIWSEVWFFGHVLGFVTYCLNLLL